MTRIRIVALLSVVLAVSVFLFDRGAPSTLAAGDGLVLDPAWMRDVGKPLAPSEHIRPGDQTFLTFPEWLLVFEPAEQADFFQQTTATNFPFQAHIDQLWDSYWIVYQQIRGNFPFNGGYHMMIVVISTSSTAEFGFKEIYETLVGRLTDTGAAVTDEDHFNAKFTRDYVDDIGTEPWYKFDFTTRLKMLWTQTSWFGPHMLRKWERKYILTSELIFKIIYARLIEYATRSAYDVPIEMTEIVIDRLPEGLADRIPGLQVLKTYPNGSAMILVPREQPFTPASGEIAAEGLQFREIAGHTSAIFLSAFVPTHWQNTSSDFKVVFTQPLATKPGVKRIAVATPIPQLGPTLRELAQQHAVIEHVFDF